MDASERAESVRIVVIMSVLGIFFAAPMASSAGAKKITEDLYITDPVNKRVFVLETTWKGRKAAKTSLVETITGFKNPTDVAVGKGVALVVDGKFVWVIDTASRAILGKVKTGKNTRFVTVTNDGKYGLATQGKRFLRIIDVAKRKAIAKIKTGKTPWKVRIDHNGEFGAVVNVGDSSITIFDLDVVLAREPGSIDGTSSRSVDGVRTLKSDVCQLSGGLDVARFEFGTWAIWSCGDAPDAVGRSAGEILRLPESAAQQAKISNENASPLNYSIASVTTARNVMWNPDCSAAFLENGVSGSEDTAAREGRGQESGVPGNHDDNSAAGRRQAEQRSFNYDWTVEKTATLGPGKMANPFSLVDGSKLSLFHPKGVGEAKVGVWNAPGKAEIFAVASTLTGVPTVCDR